MFVFLFSINFIYPQEQLWPVDVEIYVIVQGLVDGNQVGFKLTAQSSVWELSFYPNSWEFTGPTNLYNLVYYPAECQTISNTPIPWNSTNTGGYNILGGSNSWHSPSIGHGLYKFEFYNIYCEPFQYYFYIDYRDCDYPMRSRPDGTISPYSNSTGGNDIWILYDASTMVCSLSINSTYSWEEISNKNYLSYWQIKNKSTGTPYTSYFPNYWQNCLALIPSQTGNHPRLIWGPHPTFNVSSYRIYRAVSNTPVNKPMTLSYSLIQQNIPSTTFEYTDYAVDMISGYQYAYYYVKAYNGSTESSETNYVGTPAQFNKQLPEVVIIPKENILFQNYPNPFNPATRISYSIKEEGLVTLKIYDVLGKEVVTLVNENKPAGNYEAEFNASQLPSGMYIYKLQAGNFTSVSKMILIK